MTEEAMLNRIAVDQYLGRLKSPERRDLLRLTFAIECPEDWREKWPPTYAAVGRYLGLKYRGKPLSEATIRWQEMKALEELNPALAETEKIA